MGKAKGSIVIGLVKALRSNRKRALALLPARLRDYLEVRVVASQWYPEEDVLEMMRAVASLAPGRPEDVYESMGAETARVLMEGIYADVAEVRSLETRATALWEAMHDSGELVLASRGPGMARYELRGWDHASPEYCCVLKGYLAEVQRLRGASNVTVEQEECSSVSCGCCTWVCRWT